MILLHTLPKVPHGERVVLLVCISSAIAASLVSGLNAGERLGSLLIAPVMFMLNYLLARLVLPLIGGTAGFGAKVAVVAFYLSLAVAAVALLSIPYWLLLNSDSAPGEKAYFIGSAAPSALGWASAAIHRYRRSTHAA